MPNHIRTLGRRLAAILLLFIFCTTAYADELFYAMGSTGRSPEYFKQLVKPWEEKTGHKVTQVLMPTSSSDQFGQYRLWLAAKSNHVDLYQTDVIWAPQLADYFVDLTEAAKDLIPQHLPSVIASQTVDGKLVALPLFADAPALYYRKDLLEKYNRPVPESWEEMAKTAKIVQDGERAAGNKNMWGYVWQGGAYEGLTCNALEWISSLGGGHIIEQDGTITVNNKQAVKALEMAASWVGTISPKGVLTYKEEDARGLWQTGNAVFMRNWSYNYGLSNAEGSAVKGQFEVTALPAATLGGWNVAVSKYSTKREAAVSLALYLASAEGQKRFVLMNTTLPTVTALFDDADIAEKVPMVPRWKKVFLSAVARPSVPTKSQYNEISSKIWSAIHNTLSGQDTAADSLEILETELIEIKTTR